MSDPFGIAPGSRNVKMFTVNMRHRKCCSSRQTPDKTKLWATSGERIITFIVLTGSDNVIASRLISGDMN